MPHRRALVLLTSLALSTSIGVAAAQRGEGARGKERNGRGAAEQPAPPPPQGPPRKRLAVAVPPAPPAEAVPPQTIPRETLESMYVAELGKRYKPENADRVYAAHELLEQFFAEPASKTRAEIVQKIRDTKLDPGLLGRLTRLRMHWPALEPGVYYTNERHGPHDVRYFLGVPKGYDRAQRWPLVVKLPTAHAFLSAPPPGADRVTQIYSDWVMEELTGHPDALVLMPLLNLDELYGPSVPGMNTVMQPVLHAANRANVDPARVYLIGHGMSAHATWNLGIHFPTYFAAVNPLAGGMSGDWQRLRLMNLSNVLPVVWHDTADEVIKVGFARSVVKSMRAIKLDVDYEETKGVGHAPPPDVLERTYAKLRARVRVLYPKSVDLQSNRPETMYNRNDWVQIYQPLDPGKNRRMLLRRGSGPMRVYEKSSRLQAALVGGNKIQARSDNVATLRLYLNEQMVDFREPVTVTVNGKERFAKKLVPDVEPMLKDQLFLGRGWRYYTAVVDIDLAPPPSTQPTTKRSGKIIVKEPKPADSSRGNENEPAAARGELKHDDTKSR
jgi:predicted esterase